jgi:hypothetical protein
MLRPARRLRDALASHGAGLVPAQRGGAMWTVLALVGLLLLCFVAVSCNNNNNSSSGSSAGVGGPWVQLPPLEDGPVAPVGPASGARLRTGGGTPAVPAPVPDEDAARDSGAPPREPSRQPTPPPSEAVFRRSPTNAHSRHLVLGLATGIPLFNLYVFVRSLRAVSDADATLLVDEVRCLRAQRGRCCGPASVALAAG